jgi:hypothetical protein
VSGDHHAFVATGAAVYFGIAALTALNCLMEGETKVGFRGLAIAALMSLLWPLALLAVALALAWSGWPTPATGKEKP